MRPYKKIFIISIIITTLLFWYDRHKDYKSNLNPWQKFIEIIVWGSLYVITIFIVASLLYFCFAKISGWIKKTFAGRN